MKTHVLILLGVVSSLRLLGQSAEATKVVYDPVTLAKWDTAIAQIDRYIRGEIHYPALAAEQGQEGIVTVSYQVSKGGHAFDFQVKKGQWPLLDAEALRVMKALPVTISIPYTEGDIRWAQPIEFRLSGAATISKAEPRRVDVPRVYEQVDKLDQQPQYPGGDAALKAFTDSNLRYPVIDREIQGRVVVGFVINEDGSISDVTIRRSLHQAYDEEAIQLVKRMPKFIPGRLNGKAVKVRYILPVTFR